MKIYIAGHNGMVGRAIVKQLEKKINLGNPIKILTRSHSELDLTNQNAVNKFLKKEKPDRIIIAAAKVGGIHANNTYPADFIYQNLMIECNLINGAHLNNISRLLFLGSSCVYPRMATQPINENQLLTSILESTNEPYAVAKIAGIKLCESYNRQFSTDYRSIMPTNLYGPNDNYHPKNSHVVPSLIRKFHEAKVNNFDSVTIWGTGKPMREFLHVDDMAEASLFILDLEHSIYKSNTSDMCSHINIGSGKEVSILELAQIIAKTIDYDGEIIQDINMPDGTPRKLLDCSRINSMGWKSSISLREGLADTYQFYLSSI